MASSISVRLSDIVRPQRVAMLGTREGGDPGNDAHRRLMIVYSGWIAVTFGVGSSQDFAFADAFIPNGPAPTGTKVALQSFAPGNEEVGEVEIAVTAALSSFGSSPDVAAVDNAIVDLVPKQFPGFQGAPVVPILSAKLSATEGAIHAISYQVTMVLHPSLLDKVLPLNASTSP